MIIQILRNDAAPDSTLPSRFFPAAGSGGALFKVMGISLPSIELITQSLRRWCDDTMVMSYDADTGVGYFRVVDGDAPSPGATISLPGKVVWNICRDGKHVVDVLAFDKKEATDNAWDFLGWDDCAFDDEFKARYGDSCMLQVSPAQVHEVTRAISANTRWVILGCPACGVITTLRADSWPSINTDGFFVISPTATFGSTCTECFSDFVFRPRPKEL